MVQGPQLGRNVALPLMFRRFVRALSMPWPNAQRALLFPGKPTACSVIRSETFFKNHGLDRNRSTTSCFRRTVLARSCRGTDWPEGTSDGTAVVLSIDLNLTGGYKDPTDVDGGISTGTTGYLGCKGIRCSATRLKKARRLAKNLRADGCRAGPWRRMRLTGLSLIRQYPLLFSTAKITETCRWIRPS